jgi:hypothetical protein
MTQNVCRGWIESCRTSSDELALINLLSPEGPLVQTVLKASQESLDYEMNLEVLPVSFRKRLFRF